MNTVCPKDFKVCIDDTCRGSGICMRGGGPMYEKCNGCGELIGDIDSYCNCPPDYELDEDLGGQGDI